MIYASKIILDAPPWDDPSLVEFVEACVRDEVRLICVMGAACERVHDVIDELLAAGNHADILTSWHAGESLDEVRLFARSCCVGGTRGDAAQEVSLSRR